MHLLAIGGSDGGISAALRARELDPTVDVTAMLADAFPNFSICGIPYYVSGEVTHWRTRTAVIVGAGYIGLEMAEALTTRGLAVTQIEQLAEVLPTGTGPDDKPFERTADLVLVVTGVRPDSSLAADAGAKLARNGAIVVDTHMRTGLPDVFAAGDCVVTHHRLLGTTYVPLGTTAHKQGRVAGENAVGGEKEFAGSLGTQVVKIFDFVAARTGLRDHEASAAGYQPVTVAATADDHKAYYPGAKTIHLRITGDRNTGRLLGVQEVGERATAVHKRIDTAAAAIFAGLTVDAVNDLDLSYTPPLGSPWDVLQAASQAWWRETRRS